MTQSSLVKGVAASRGASVSAARPACFTSRPISRQLIVRAQAERETSRRESLAGVAAVFAGAIAFTRPAHALLGIGEEGEKDDEYKKLTTEVIGDVKSALALEKDDPGRPDAIQKARDETTAWVAKYRRDGTFQGRPSYGTTYSALSAIAGHYNSFGPETNLPKKRLDRVNKELADAEKFVVKGR